jgi:hypothetical protein
MSDTTHVDPASPGSPVCRCTELSLEVAELRDRLDDVAPFLLGEPNGELDGIAELYRRTRVLEKAFLAIGAISQAADDSAFGACVAAERVTSILGAMHDPLRRQRDVDDEDATCDLLDGLDGEL